MRFQLSNLIAELSLRTTWHETHVSQDMRSMCCMWFAHDCARATWAGDGSRHSEEIVKYLVLPLWRRLWLLVVVVVKIQYTGCLAVSMQDSCYHVRLRFALKLHKGLLSLRLPLEYMSIFSLAANDPLKERRTQLKQFLNSNVQKRRDYLKQNPNARGMSWWLVLLQAEP